MQKVDRLGWVAGFSVRSYGVRIGIRSNEPSCLEKVCEFLPHGSTISSAAVVERIYSLLVGGNSSRPGTRRLNILYGDHIRLARSLKVDDLFNTFESDLRLTVAEFARQRVFVHAGVVGWKGKAIVVPGRSFTGKSSLIVELIRAGATYYSDEYAVFDRYGYVHPFLKPLEIRNNGEYRQRKVEVAQLGGRAGIKPIPVGLVLITEFKEHAHWKPRELSPGKGVLALFANTVSARRSPEQALGALKQVVGSARVLKGVRGEARSVARAILERLESV